MHVAFDVVIPSIGRPSLAELLRSLAACRGPLPRQVLLVDDRMGPSSPMLAEPVPARLAGRVHILAGPARGPAAARNIGWRRASAPWVAFLDDDVVVEADWLARLDADLAGLPTTVAGSQGRITVPLPTDRRPTDWERNVSGLERARWATADMAFRRAVLEQAGGFDERFPRAYREDADLALRVLGAGYRLERGTRRVRHPVRPADPWVSLRLQAGNADDALMRRLHGPAWRTLAEAPPGRLARHGVIVSAGLLGLAGWLAGRPRAALLGGSVWAAGSAELAWDRVAPGPRTVREIAGVVLTSLVLPWAAVWHRVRGTLAARGTVARRPPRLERVPVASTNGRPAAVLFDRDGTLVEDVPYNGDPGAVRPVDGARAALDRLRAAGIRVAVVSNQSGIGRGLLARDAVARVDARIDELLGPFDAWAICPHPPDEGCACRKPGIELLRRAADALGVRLAACAVVGDIGSDVEAARAAGSRSVLVPTPTTLPEEVAAAPAVARSLAGAVDLLLGGAGAAGAEPSLPLEAVSS